jgi:Dolichyl-phosphate-mannose-protein mannosyltransferase
MTTKYERYYTPMLAFLLMACIVRFWLFLLPESFWLDETVTAFIIRHGGSHPSLAAAPGLGESVYYWLPRISQSLLGFSEFSLRLPSFLVTLVSLFVIARLAVRFIHPQAGWVAVFLCFIPHEFTRQATDARPYGLATCVALCGIWFLVRWLDQGAWRDAALFAVFAALLLHVHLIYWPFYAVFAFYALLRWRLKETAVPGHAIAIVFAILIASLVHLVPPTLALFKDARAHVVTDLPTLKIILGGFQILMIAAAAAGMWLAGKALGWQRERLRITTSGKALLLSWWLWQPGCLLLVSWMTGNPVFLARYFSVAIPGMTMMCTLAAGYSIPARAWKPIALGLAVGILTISAAKSPFPPSRGSHWREAALAVNSLVKDTSTPVICPSAIIEAQPPLWTQAYSLPGFFYSHLDVYPIQGAKVLLPARLDPEGESYARSEIKTLILPAGRFVIYGGVQSAFLWETWFAAQPEMAGWSDRHSDSFGDLRIAVFEAVKPGAR